MKIVTQKTEVWGECPTTLEGAIPWVERAGRTCYRSEDKIIEGSGRKFVDGIIRRNHLSVIEHSNFVIRTIGKLKSPLNELKAMRCTCYSPFLRYINHNGYIYVGGNFRAWMDTTGAKNIDELFSNMPFGQYKIVENAEDIPVALKTFTVEFLTDRAVTHELVRHRPCAFSQESQRYCAYKQHLEVLLPYQYADIPQTKDSDQMGRYQTWVKACEYAEKSYKELMRVGEKAEQARSVLPNSTATKIVATATVPEWEHIFSMRTSPAAYPGIRNLINPVKQYFNDAGLLP